MFPYPSGAGLHVGHPLGYIASDIISRYKRHKGFNVLHPMGYDSFGLPAEQYAIQTGQHPEKTTRENIARYREQLDKIGFSFDWDREVQTSNPDYYRWTQWIFLQLFNSWYHPKNKKAEKLETLITIFEKEGFRGEEHNILTGEIEKDLHVFTADEWKNFSEEKQQNILMHFRLAYLSEAYVNWCPQMGTVLANDEVKDGVSERGGYPVERKLMKQWSMRITAYADRLLDGLNQIDWTESIKDAQRNWIGKSEGSSIRFKISSSLSFGEGRGEAIEVFTTRPDTLFGVSYLTLAPESDLVNELTTSEQKEKVEAYVTFAKNRSERERMADVKNITGVFTGSYAIHPFTTAEIPVWIGDYVLAGYGTGAVMAVPSHDTRDFAFAKHFGLPMKQVVETPEGWDLQKEAYDEKKGKIINSDFLNGLEVKDAIKKCIVELEKINAGKGKINFRLRDAVFGRQRYWGEPIPIYYKNGIPYGVDEKDLPVTLPEVDKYLPTEDGEPPLARAKNWFYLASPQPSPEERGERPGFQTANKKIWNLLKENSKENRKNPTNAEEILWQNLRNYKTGFYFRRQHVIINFIADFVCLDRKLIVEVDGGYHELLEQKEYDEARTYILEQCNYEIIRFTNEEVIDDVQKVIERIKLALEKRSSIKDDSSSLSFGEGRGEAAFPLEPTTMPGWAGSSWYFLRYMDANNSTEFASKEKMEYWKEIDLYIGGAEHSTGHLLYFRFWTKFLKDLGYISIEEPAKKLINQGMIQGMSALVYRENNSGKILSHGLIKGRETTPLHIDVNIVNGNEVNIESLKKWRDEFANAEYELENGKLICGSEIGKMSKRWHNVVNPDDICEKFGADTLRLYEMFLGPLEDHKPWNTNGIEGVSRFLKKLCRLFENVTNDAPTKQELKSLHKCIKKVNEEIEKYSFNTVVSTYMICVNELGELKCSKKEILESFVILLSPYAPHLAEELWEKLGNKNSISTATYPICNEEYLIENNHIYPVQFNGKMRFNIELPLSLSPAEIEKIVLEAEDSQKYLEGKTPKKVIVVPGRIVNIVV
jgi:leucyl-tRNA synthetase